MARISIHRRRVPSIGARATSCLPPAVRRTCAWLRSWIGGAAARPALIVWLIFFVVPVVVFTSISVLEESNGGLTARFYVKALSDPFYLNILGRTWLSAVVTVIATLAIGYPAAFFISGRSLAARKRLMLAALFPLLISSVIHLFGWLALLSPAGLINNSLRTLGLIHEPLDLLNKPATVVLGLVSSLLPFMIVNVTNALLAIDARLAEAAAIHGATEFQIFRRVTLPLSRPGVISGCVLVFTIAMSAYVVPLILGGPVNRVMGTVVFDAISSFDWSFASALSVILVAVTLISCGVFLALSAEPWRRGQR